MMTTEFMLQLAKRLQDDRGIAESTAAQYLRSLYALNDRQPFKNLAWTKKYEDIQRRIDGYAESTRASLYTVLVSALSLFASKPAYKAAHAHWTAAMNDAEAQKKATAASSPHTKTEKQADNWMSWDEVASKASALSTEVSSFLSSKHLTPAQWDRLTDCVVMALYTMMPPRRNADFFHMWVVRKMPAEPDRSKNYYDASTGRFHFHKYKTSKTYGEQVEEAPEGLRGLLREFIRHHPLAGGKTREFRLLVRADGTPPASDNAITRILNRLFGKKVGSSMLRHIYLSSKYGDQVAEMEADAAAMGHSVGQQKEYIKA
jgi:integrase